MIKTATIHQNKQCGGHCTHAPSCCCISMTAASLRFGLNVDLNRLHLMINYIIGTCVYSLLYYVSNSCEQSQFAYVMFFIGGDCVIKGVVIGSRNRSVNDLEDGRCDEYME
eukprot:75132_1